MTSGHIGEKNRKKEKKSQQTEDPFHKTETPNATYENFILAIYLFDQIFVKMLITTQVQ